MLPTPFFEQWTLIRAGTRATGELVPDDRLDFRPHPEMVPLGELMRHIVGAVYFLLRRRLGREIEIPSEIKDKRPLDRSAFLAQLDATDRLVRQAMEELSEADLEKAAYEEDGREWSVGYVIWHIGEHEIHHRAQLKMYLKLLGLETSGLPY